jgi:hypothetical protein
MRKPIKSLTVSNVQLGIAARLCDGKKEKKEKTGNKIESKAASSQGTDRSLFVYPLRPSVS